MKGILKISDATAIAIHTVIILAANHEKQFSNKEISTMLSVSENHLAKIMQRLAKAGLVESIRGPRGGFVISQKGSNCALLDVYEAIEGPLELSNCMLSKPFCNNNCLLGDFLVSINHQFKDYFSKTKISEFTKMLRKENND